MTSLTDRRVLVVEDEAIISMMVEDALMDAGAVVVGPASSVEKALELIARGEPIDAAAIDMNLNGRLVTPVAQALTARGIPVVMLTGYDLAGIPDELKSLPLVSKPFSPERLVAAIGEAMAPAGSSHPTG
jgi:DNA-binding NtrC family response regulator